MRLHSVKKCLGAAVLGSLLAIVALYGWGVQHNNLNTWYQQYLTTTLTPAHQASRDIHAGLQNTTKVREAQAKNSQPSGWIGLNGAAQKPSSRHIASTNRTESSASSYAPKDLSLANQIVLESSASREANPSSKRTKSGDGHKTSANRLVNAVSGIPNDSPAGMNISRSVTDTSDLDRRLLRSRTPGVVSKKKGMCSALHHLAFLKVHKTGSSTVANILQRYGFTRHLNFVLPNKPFRSSAYNYINKPGKPITPDSILPPPNGGHYDLLWNHAIYNRTVFSSFMPRDTVYVAILREPFQQFLSSFAYYNGRARVENTSTNPFSDYLHSKPSKLMDYFHNKQSQDLGMDQLHVGNSTLRRHYIAQLSTNLNLVMLTEFFDESLVLLRRLMCWSVKDVLYITQNKNNRRPSLVFSYDDYALHRQLSAADYDLYDFFRRKFLRTLQAQGWDFAEEVNHFKEVLQQVTKFCKEMMNQVSDDQFFVPRSAWSPEFSVSHRDCAMLHMSELSFLDILLAARNGQDTLVKSAPV